MRHVRLALPALAASLLLPGAAAADDNPANDAPIATSQGSGSPTTARQIQEFLDSSPAACRPDELPLEEARRPHGEVSVGVGTGGYRSAHVRGDFPVGRTGSVSVAVGQTRGGYGWGPRGYSDFGMGFDYASRAALEREIARQSARADDRPPCAS